jgi:hypothetical protein
MSGLAGGGRSPVRTFLRAEFPANREKYREFWIFSRNHLAITPHSRVF